MSLALLAAVAGCTSGSSAILESARLAVGKAPAAETPELDPRYLYLRTAAFGHTLYLVLGFVDHDTGGEVHVWYSAGGEVVRTQAGRIVGTAGLPTDWREVRRSKLPSWREALSAHTGYQRERDVMPGYHAATRDQVSIRPIPAPASSLLVGRDPQGLSWFEEVTTTPDARLQVPPARFAVDFSDGGERVVYSEQCLAAELCLAMQPWTAQDSAALSGKKAGGS